MVEIFFIYDTIHTYFFWFLHNFLNHISHFVSFLDEIPLRELLSILTI